MATRHGLPWKTLPILPAKTMTTREDMLQAVRPPLAAYLWGCCPNADTYDDRRRAMIACQIAVTPLADSGH